MLCAYYSYRVFPQICPLRKEFTVWYIIYRRDVFTTRKNYWGIQSSEIHVRFIQTLVAACIADEHRCLKLSFFSYNTVLTLMQKHLSGFGYKQTCRCLISRWVIAQNVHVNEYPTMHHFGNPIHTESMIAYIGTPEQIWANNHAAKIKKCWDVGSVWILCFEFYLWLYWLASKYYATLCNNS